jgi:hypothetical protein
LDIATDASSDNRFSIVEISTEVELETRETDDENFVEHFLDTSGVT